MSKLDIIWFGDEKLKTLRSLNCNGWELAAKSFWKDQFQKIRFEHGDSWIEFFVSIYDEDGYEYEYIDFEFEHKELIVTEGQLPKIGIYLKHHHVVDEAVSGLVGTYKNTEEYSKLINWQNMKNAKLVCRSIYIPSLDFSLKIGSYPDSLEIANGLYSDAHLIIL